MSAARSCAGGRSGGEVKVESREGTLLASGLIDGQGNEGPGGLVWLLAPRVGLIREAVVNVSGLTGGGTVLVGGDFQGKNPDIQNAWRTYFGPDATVRADAIQSGNGGKVIVWADDRRNILAPSPRAAAHFPAMAVSSKCPAETIAG